jgi:hypothetical protein
MQAMKNLDELWNSGLTVLELPESPRADMTGIDPKSTVLIRTNVAGGQVLIALDANQPRKVVAVAVSPNLVDRFDMSKLGQGDGGANAECWDKPTNAGVLGCVLETLLRDCCS